MPTLYEPVHPGDVISSDLFNDLILKLQELEERIGALEGSAGGDLLLITGFNPPLQVSAGQLLEIEGANFETPASANTVTIGGTPVTEFLAGSTSVLLRIIVPASISVPTGGSNLTVRITNTLGSVERLYRILPEVPAVGDPPEFVSADVVNDDESAQPLIIGEFCRIRGQNFAQTPSENVVTFTVVVDGVTTVYPPEGETLDIDEGGSSTTEIRVRVPDITEVQQVGIPVPSTLQVTVGAHPPAADTVLVKRSS